MGELGITRIDISDATFPVFLGLMQYLYTDHLKLPPHQIIHLGDLAARYRLPRLRSMCLKALQAMESRKIEGDIVQVPPSEFSIDMRTSLQSGECSDIQFKNRDGTLIPAHRAILT